MDAPLERHGDTADTRVAGPQRLEKGGFEDKLLLLLQPLLDVLEELRCGHLGGRSVELNRSVENLQQRQAADITKEDGTATCDVRDHSVQDSVQVLEARKVLDHGVENHEVEPVGGQA